MTVFLLKNVDTDTVGEIKGLNGANRSIQVQAADFGGGKVTLEYKVDARLPAWQIVPVQDGGLAEFTENAGIRLVGVSRGMRIRATLSGSSDASGVYVAMSGSATNKNR